MEPIKKLSILKVAILISKSMILRAKKGQF
jgi:hypothetical protein